MPYRTNYKKRATIMPPRETNPEKMALAAREDLPEEVTECFITMEKLLKMKGKGGIMTSMWAPRPDELVDVKDNTQAQTWSSLDPPAEKVVRSNANDNTWNLAEPSPVDSSLDSWAKQSTPRVETPKVIAHVQKTNSSVPANTDFTFPPGYIPPHLRRTLTPTPPPTFTVVRTTPIANLKRLTENLGTAKGEAEAQRPKPAVDDNLAATGSGTPWARPAFTVVRTTPIANLKRMTENLGTGIEETKAQRPKSAVDDNLAATGSETPRAPKDSPKKPTQLASSWEEFTSWGALTEYGHNFSTGSYGRPVLTATKKNAEKSTNVQKDENEAPCRPPNVAAAKVGDDFPIAEYRGVDQEVNLNTQENPVQEASVPVPGWEDLTISTRPIIEETTLKSIKIAPVSESGQSALDQAVSDDGVGSVCGEIGNAPIFNDKSQQHELDSRNYLAPEVRVMQGTAGPIVAPYSFMIEGNPFTFVKTYVSKWSESLPMVEGQVDMECDQFKTGIGPITHMMFEEAIEQPISYPDVVNSSNMQKQQNQTAEIDAKFYQRKKIRRQRYQERSRFLEPGVGPSTQFPLPTRNPWAPNITMYLRAAREKDIPGVTAIFNHYVSNSIVPEDQIPVSETMMLRVLTTCRDEALPFIVAVKGNPPAEDCINDDEVVLGFGFTKDNLSSVGLNNSGRSRFTAQIEFYVHPEYLRKGVGRSILDRILSALGSSHACHDGCDFFFMPGDESMYGQPPACVRNFHQIFIHRPIHRKNDPDIEWFSRWLKRFYIYEVGRFLSVGRSNKVGGLPRFLDLVIFQFEASTELEYSILI